MHNKVNEFLEKLYNYEYFGTYLMIAIIVLLLLFIIILFFGKKDQKNREIEATKKLQQINNENAFKEESTPAAVNINKPVEEIEKIVVPTIDIIPQMYLDHQNDNNVNNNVDNNLNPNNNINHNVNNTIENLNTNMNNNNTNNTIDNNISSAPIESINLNINENVSTPIENIGNIEVNQQVEKPSIPEDVSNEAPILEKVEEKPLIFNEPDYSFLNPIKEEKVEPQELTSEVEVPKFDFDEVVNSMPKVKSAPQPFSSVYAPGVPNLDDIPLPDVPLPNSDEEDMDFELPTLKKDTEEVELPNLNDFNLDEISGETYNIK